MPYREITTRGITLLCFPPQDVAFSTIAVRYLDAGPRVTPDALQAELRVMYPNAIVRPRESFAALGGNAAWYVYRDGRYSPFAGDGAPWWEHPDAAFLVIETESGRYVDANAAALELIGIDRERLLAMRTGDLVHREGRVTVPWVWKLLHDVGEIHSTSLMQTPDGREVPVEYHLVRDGAGPGRAKSFMRAAPIEAVRPPEGAPGPADA